MRSCRCRVMQVFVIAVLIVMWGDVAAAQETITVIINSVEAESIDGETAYEVTAYVTVADSNGQPITGLTEDDFTLTEDGEDVAITSLAYVERSATIVLVLDTSGSMLRDDAIATLRESAVGFISNLSENDQVGIIYFNDTVVMAQNLSNDLQGAASIVGLLEAEIGAGTCLYDAACDAVTMATGAPPGQRAVVLFTDGVDERGDSDEPCSAHTGGDVIALALGGVTHVPIYTIGLGDTIDTGELARISESTGGHALVAPEADDIAALFQAVAHQLKNQYTLTYRSETTSGEHGLTVVVDVDGVVDIGAGNFIAPIVLNLSGLDDGAILDGSRMIRATASGADIARVTFELDGETLPEIASPPFEITLDSAALVPGEHELVAMAILEDGAELTGTLQFEAAAVVIAGPTEGVIAEPPGDGDGFFREILANLPSWALPVGIGGGAFILVSVAIVVIAIALSRKKRGAARAGFAGTSDMTTDIRLGPTLATLIVEESLSLKHGQRFDLTREIIKLGRGIDNDIVVPDAPVSRLHAEIHFKVGTFQVFDKNSSYGTFVNGAEVGFDGLPLQHGDTLGLGTRTRMIFTTPQQAGASPEDRTMDIFADSDDNYETAALND